MTRKDYELIAKVFKQCLRVELDMVNDGSPTGHPSAHASVKFAVETLSHKLALDNPRFDRDKFLKACGIEQSKPRLSMGMGRSVAQD